MDVNEKPASKFPRSSLRASNKTMIVSSSEAQKLRLESAREQIVSRQTVSVGADQGALGNDEVKEPLSNGALLDEMGLEETLSEDLNDRKAAEFQEKKATEIIAEDDLGDLLGGLDHPLDSASTGQQMTQPLPIEEELPERFDLSEPDVVTEDAVADGFPPRDSEVMGSSIPEIGVNMRARVHEQNLNLQPGKKEYIQWQRPSKLIGFLVSFDAEPFGSYVELREGRLVVSSEFSVSENCLVIADASVSPMHAIMRIGSDGTILILDQLSEHGTRIKRDGDSKEEALMGDKSSLGHGDMVIFGECAYHVCILKRAES